MSNILHFDVRNVSSMKARFKYHIYIYNWDKNTDQQGCAGCVPVVWNDSLACFGGKVQTLKEKTD